MVTFVIVNRCECVKLQWTLLGIAQTYAVPRNPPRFLGEPTQAMEAFHDINVYVREVAPADVEKGDA
jgi:hypothetical protein